MRALKLLVVVMGVMLVAGTIALIAAVVIRGRNGSVASLERAASASIAVELPPGARIAMTEMAGDRLLVRLTLPQGGEQLLVFNLSTGARIATIELRPAAGDARR